MREQLQTEIINTIFPYRNNVPFEDIKAQVTIILSNYDVKKRETELAILNEDKNEKYVALFLASKAAGGRTEKTLKAYRNYLTRIFATIGKDADLISSDDIKLYLAKRLRIDKCTKVSVDNERRSLSTFYGWMLKNEHIAKDPMNKVETMKYSKPKKICFFRLRSGVVARSLPDRKRNNDRRSAAFNLGARVRTGRDKDIRDQGRQADRARKRRKRPNCVPKCKSTVGN